MQRTSFAHQQCPIARSLDCVGEWWSILILRDAFHGLSRFDEFQESLGIASNMLSRRLKALVKSGLLKRQEYQRQPTRHEYVLTARGSDFLPVILALLAWGNRHLAPEGIAVRVADLATGKPVDPVIVDRLTMKLLTAGTVTLAAGPAAGAGVRARVAQIPNRASDARRRAAGRPEARRSSRVRSQARTR
jgi:DNA-binding HxlR family transcriptional regulator